MMTELAHSRKIRVPSRPSFRRSIFTIGALLHAPSLEEPGIGRILLDVCGVALLRDVNFNFVFAINLVHFGVIARPLMAAIG